MEIVSSIANFAPHVGHKVELTGTAVKSGVKLDHRGGEKIDVSLANSEMSRNS